MTHKFIISNRAYNEMASGVYNLLDSSSNNLINGVVLLQEIPYYKLSCLEMAARADSQQFIAMQSIQNVLADIWVGKIKIEHNFVNNLKVICFILLFITKIFTE